ncbi:MAG: putative rane protein [Gaiellales bacterium]|nr:putative rane protein [Gaiellales bacterium]MDX6597125.1 putative rane protein [Gaiellales bacterium]
MSEPVDPRFRLANERTLLSWMRVALALVAAGTTAGTVVDIKPTWLHACVAIGPILLGLAAALLGFTRWQRVEEAMRTGVELPPDRELRVVAISVAVLAVVAGAAALIGVFSS